MFKKNKNLKLLSRLFPFVDDNNKFKQIKIDCESIYYITDKEHASEITTIIIGYLQNIKLNPNNISIIDATAGVGGNVISFGKNFKNVLAIEINKKRCYYLKNNIDVYNLNNIKILNDDFTKFITNNINMMYNIIFIDPPWGGIDYKKKNKLTLSLSNVLIENLCNDILMIKKIILIVLKLPFNYDLEYLYNKINSHNIHVHTLNKMLLVIIQK